jgi:hypothetical protein
MKKQNKQILGLALIFAGIIFAIFLFGSQKDDVSFCRDIFRGFVTGSQSLQGYVDWQHLKALGLDVGATYSKLPNQQEKDDYRREFYKNFSASFKRNNGAFSAFTNWRIYSQNSSGTIIAVNYNLKSKTALFTLSGSGNKQLTDIKWEGLGD